MISGSSQCAPVTLSLSVCCVGGSGELREKRECAPITGACGAWVGDDTKRFSHHRHTFPSRGATT